jgi:putative ABC transport system permease protein
MLDWAEYLRRRLAGFGGLWQDVRYAARILRKQPGFAAAVVLTLGLGIAANTVVFTVVNGALLRELPFEGADRIVSLGVRNLGNADSQGSGLSYADFQDWRTAQRTFEGIGAAAEDGVDMSDNDRPAVRVRGAYVSWDTFALIRQQPALGRAFSEADDRPGAAPVVILGEAIWRTRYLSDPRILGSTIRVDGVPSTIIGVMPQGFGFPLRAEIWVPLVALPEDARTSRSNRLLEGVGRLRPGVSYEQATAELSGITTALAEQYPASNRNTAPRIEPLRTGIGAPILGVVVALLGAVAFVLLIACANTANLLLARAAERTRDVAVRLALGASRWRIVRQLLVESLVLATVAGVLGLGLSYVGIQIFWSLAAESAPPYWLRFPIDRAVFAYFTVICLSSSVLCGLVPAWQASRSAVVATLNDMGRTSSSGRCVRRWTGAFVVAQVALALVLLTGATLMIQNLLNRMRADIGVDTGRLVQMEISLSARIYDTPERRLLFYKQLEEGLASNGNTKAVLASHAPVAGAVVRRPLIEGRPPADAGTLPPVSVLNVGQRYFEVVGTVLTQGRMFTAADMRTGSEAVVVNQQFAKTYFRDESVIGQRMRLASPNSTGTGPEGASGWVTVIGVVSNVRQRQLRSGEFDPVLYVPYAIDALPTMSILARSDSDLASTVGVIRDQVRALDSELPVFNISTVQAALSVNRWPQRVFGSMFAIFALIAVSLATVGLYAVTAYAVSRRTREIGVRVALGADARQVWLTVTGPTLRQLALGLLMGLAGAAAVATVLPAMVVGTTGANPLILIGVAILMLVVGIAACVIPGLRATRLDPIAALRSE